MNWSAICLFKAVESPILDDNHTNRRILHHLVFSWGMIASEAASAADAVEPLCECETAEPGGTSPPDDQPGVQATH